MRVCRKCLRTSESGHWRRRGVRSRRQCKRRVLLDRYTAAMAREAAEPAPTRVSPMAKVSFTIGLYSPKKQNRTPRVLPGRVNRTRCGDGGCRRVDTSAGEADKMKM